MVAQLLDDAVHGNSDTPAVLESHRSPILLSGLADEGVDLLVANDRVRCACE